MIKSERSRIIFLIDSLGVGGAERLLVPYLQYLDQNCFEPRVCVMQVREGNPIAADIQRLDIPIDLVSTPNLSDPRNLPRLVRYLRQHKAGLLHTQLEFSDTLGNIAARILNIPAVSTLHTFDDPPRGTRTYWRLQLRWWSLRHFCDRIIAVSEGTRQHHLRLGKLAPGQVMTMYNGIDLSRFTPAQNGTNGLARRESFGIPPDAPLLITVAVLRPPKGIQYMIEALPAILEAVPQAYYLVVGDGEHAETLKALTTEYNVAERVIFAGVRKDIPDLLAISDLFVLPTLGEALPTVLAEAMAAHKPIVVSQVGGVPEMVEHGRNGLLTPPAEPTRLAQACIQLLQNPGQAQAMAQAGREIVQERFNIRKQVQCLGDLYQEILAEYRR